MKKIAILGSTGSIGTQALEVCDAHPEDFSVVAITCGTNLELLSSQIIKYRPKIAVIAKEEDAKILQERHKDIEVLFGREGLNTAASCHCDIVLNALMGIKGLEPTYKAIKAGKTIALANKETLVAGGEIIMNAAKENNVKILPVDSEHSAIFQCLQGNNSKNLKKILLTGSGGPFRSYAREAMERVTVEQALRHPKWTMGPKITIDSATMMNKGLEVIEAKWLFDVGLDQIQVVIHPQSVVHSMVEFSDSAIIAQLGVPDMKVPIAFALTYPDRFTNNFEKLDFTKEMNLSFEKPDFNKFRCLKLAYEASEKGDSFPIALNGANEVLVDLFLNKKIRFPEISRKLDHIISNHTKVEVNSIDDILEVDKEVRIKTLEMCGVNK